MDAKKLPSNAYVLPKANHTSHSRTANHVQGGVRRRRARRWARSAPGRPCSEKLRYEPIAQFQLGIPVPSQDRAL